MRIPLLLIGLALFLSNADAQTGLQSVYNPTVIVKKKRTNQFRGNATQQLLKSDTIFREGKPIFWQYLPKKRNYRALLPIDSPLALGNLNSNSLDSQIDLEKTRNRAKLLFFKMKMWGYFKY